MKTETYLSIIELEQISSLLGVLNDNLDGGDISIGETFVYDCNGEVVGKIGCSEPGYVLMTGKFETPES